MPKRRRPARSGSSALDQSVEQPIGVGQGREARDGQRREVAAIGAVDLAPARRAARAAGPAGMTCWWVIGSGWPVSAMSSRASARQLPPTMIERPSRRSAAEAGGVDRLADPLGERAAFSAQRVEAEHAERQRGAAQHPAARDLDQLQAAAAEIADDAVGVGDGGEHALARRVCLPPRRTGCAASRPSAAHRVEEGGAVRGLAHRGGGDDAGARPRPSAAISRRKRSSAASARACAVSSIAPVSPTLAAEPGHHLLVEDHRRDPRSRPNRRRGGPSWSRCR